jgi:YXWGXW repeat-containing protein
MRLRISLMLAGLSLSGAALMSGTADAQISIGVSVNVAPPELPVYEQPAMPAVGYMWSPGYWAWGGQDYYWVPGTWVQAPQPGYLWTPGYWGWGEGGYLWHEGYWGPHVGFYGGVNYGFGYVGTGYGGGYWQGGAFYYNRSVNNIPESVHITNVYNKTIINNVTVNRVSFNGGTGGIAARPTAEETAFAREPHLPPVADQVHHAELARSEPSLHTATNHGAPAIAATAHAASFTGPGVVGARGAAPLATHPAGAPGAPGGAAPGHPPTAGAPGHPLAVTPAHPPAAGPPHPPAPVQQHAPAPPKGGEHEEHHEEH